MRLFSAEVLHFSEYSSTQMLHIYFRMVQLPALVTVMNMPSLVSFGAAACRHGVVDQAVED